MLTRIDAINDVYSACDDGWPVRFGPLQAETLIKPQVLASKLMVSRANVRRSRSNSPQDRRLVIPYHHFTQNSALSWA